MKTRKHRIRGGTPSPTRFRVSPLPFHVFSSNNQTSSRSYLPPIGTSQTSSTRGNMTKNSPMKPPRSFANPTISTQPIVSNVVPTNETFIKKTIDYVKNKHFNFPLFGWLNSKGGLTVSPMVVKMCFMKCNKTNNNIIDEKMSSNDYSLTEDEMHLFGLDWKTECRFDVLDSCKELFIYREKHTIESTKHEFASVPHQKKMDFIKLKNGPLFFFDNKEGKSGGHSEIIKVLNNSVITLIDENNNNTIVKNPVVMFCEMAGELWLDENDEISKWNNLSGTFLPVVNVISLLPFDKYVNELQ